MIDNLITKLVNFYFADRIISEIQQVRKEISMTKSEFEAKLTELRDAQAALNVAVVNEAEELKAKLDALHAKIEELGQFPDLTADIEALKASAAKIAGFSELDVPAEPMPEPAPAEEPAPVEVPAEEPQA